jgi:hypothetical protein
LGFFKGRRAILKTIEEHPNRTGYILISFDSRFYRGVVILIVSFDSWRSGAQRQGKLVGGKTLGVHHVSVILEDSNEFLIKLLLSVD